MIRSFRPAEGYNNVEFAAGGQAELVVVPAEGLEVETHEEYEIEDPENPGETLTVQREINVDLLLALEAHEFVVDAGAQPSLPIFNPPPPPQHDGDPED